MAEKILEFCRVSSDQKQKFKLMDISFALPAGYIMGLMGENGAGKTTLFDYILDDEKRYSGVIRLNGMDISEEHKMTKQKIGFVSEKNSFFEKLTGIRNAELLGNLYDEFDIELFQNTMKKMEIPDILYERMSRGQKMKFQLAFAMAHKPELYLLDEVTAGMDPVFRTELFQLLQEVIGDAQASVLMTSHIESEMEKKVDYLGIMENGKLTDFGEASDVISRTQKRSS